MNMKIEQIRLYDDIRRHPQGVPNECSAIYTNGEVYWQLHVSTNAVWLFEAPTIRYIDHDDRMSCMHGKELVFRVFETYAAAEACFWENVDDPSLLIMEGKL